jgi:hypothetical protein
MLGALIDECPSKMREADESVGLSICCGTFETPIDGPNAAQGHFRGGGTFFLH